MNRNEMISTLRNHRGTWDVIVIGGGASGLGTAVDAASRGYSTLLLERDDFAKGTSSRSTKLIHGGVRYLQQGDVSLVMEALRERGLIFQNAPHLSRNQSFVIPNYEWWGGPFYTVGLKVYDMMAGKLGIGPSQHLSREETLQAIPTVVKRGLKGGVIYQDGQFDDARMAITLAQTAADYGAVLLNYCAVTDLIKENGLVTGVRYVDRQSKTACSVHGKVVINATGVFADSIRKMDDPEAKKMIQPSQGVHIVLDKKHLPGKHAIMVPQTTDGRVLFAVPWYDKVVVGTTDTVVDDPSPEPKALPEEIHFILDNASRYLDHPIGHEDIRSIFAGLRPLAAPEGDEQPTREISRHHKILISVSGLITISGGKWTTYRKMAQDAVDNAATIGGLPSTVCITENLLLHGYKKDVDHADPLAVYGTDIEKMLALEKEQPQYAGLLSPALGIRKSQVIRAVREEMAVTVEDVLARRTRALFLDARESVRIAPVVGQLMAEELKKNKRWIHAEMDSYLRLAKNYYLEDAI
jgi:glycerol-3-phosphate dehydrogenase